MKESAGIRTTSMRSAILVLPIMGCLVWGGSIPPASVLEIESGGIEAVGIESGGLPNSTFEEHELAEMIDVYCLDCHGARRAVGGVDLEAVAKNPGDPGIDPVLLLRLRDRLRARDMPPPDATLTPEEAASVNPSAADYERAIEETGRILAERSEIAGVPAVTIRRIGRRELQRTLVDLFGEIEGLDSEMAGLPADDVGHGFDHLGEVLSTSPLHVEKMIDLAEFIARRVVVDPEVPLAEIRTFPHERLRGGQARPGGIQLNRRGEVFLVADLPRPGRYRVEFDLAGQQAGDEPVRFGLRIDRRTVRTVDVPEDRSMPATHSVEFESSESTVRFGAVFLNDFYERAGPDGKPRDRNAMVTDIRLVGPLDPGEPTVFQRSLDARMTNAERRKGTALAARDLLERCWGRRIDSEEALAIADRLIAAADVVANGNRKTSRMEIQKALVLYAMVSPEFFYRVERADADAEVAADGSVPLDGYSVARRLASFLRGGPPDERLLTAARRGLLDEDEGLLREMRRLLRTDAPRALAERFAVQWLHVDGIEGLEPDPARFGEIDSDTLADMREETVLAFTEIVEKNRPITDLFRSRTTWLSRRLAEHYGWDPERLGVPEQGFRRIDLASADVPQADLGILRHASVLMSTSNPTRTSPVKRGKWVLESLLDSPPPPPPPGVDQLPSVAVGDEEKKSLRAMLEAHRADPDCAGCHLRMDALGFALEPFDAAGRWRSSESANIDAEAVLPDGTVIDGPFDLRDVLIRDPALLRSFAKHLLVFALGRGPEWRDEPLIDKIVEGLSERPTVARAVEIIVLSDAFRRRPAIVPDT